jgi:glycerol-1-phosphate dehydrogenase [NAD(P)+]
MDVAHLESVAAVPDDGEVIVGLGGGTALDTAKFLAWKHNKQLVQIPTITSVDAGFTDAVGVRVDGRVRYIGRVIPQLVILDIPLIQSAPPRLNQAGIGDILSCHTGLFDWRLAADGGHGHPWDDRLAALGQRLLEELADAADEIAAVSDAGIRFIADAYRRIGAACAAAGHSRFEEGSEHFWAYAYEHATGAHPVHGEIISLAVCALAHIQGNDPTSAAAIVRRAGTRAHPDDLGVRHADFVECLVGLAAYSRDEGLDISIADARPITNDQAFAAWEFVQALPRR